MTTTRKVAKYVTWTLFGVLALAIVLYLGMLAVNWRDQPPSAAALELRRVLDERPPVANIDNAYVYMLGFSAPRERDPQEAGERRLEWIQSRGYARDSNVPDPVPNAILRAERSQAVSAACLAATRACEDALEKNSSSISDGQGSDALLLERYRTFLQRSTWQELVPFDSEMPIPLYGGTTDAQRLHLLSMWHLSGLGDVDAVRAGLDADLAFWRRVLGSSDLLITKMVAVGAIRQHFIFGYLGLKRLPADKLGDALPQSWQIEISKEERSLLRPLAGEVAFASGMFRKNIGEPGAFVSAEQEYLARVGSSLLLPLFKPQDSINQIAERYLVLVRAFDVPLSSYPAVKLEMDSKDDPVRVFARIYNPVGDLFADMNPGALTRYPARVGDIEGMRRTAVLALQLRNRSVAPEHVAEELQQADLRDPYHQEPFEWDANEKAVVFVGLEEGERGRHVYGY